MNSLIRPFEINISRQMADGNTDDITDYLEPLYGLSWMIMIIEYTAQSSQLRDSQRQQMSCFNVPTRYNHFKHDDALLLQVDR